MSRREKESRRDDRRDEQKPRMSTFFVPGAGIDREVITTDICRHLGNDALVKPGSYQDPRTGEVRDGYLITAYRALTTAQLADLKADSARWQAERQRNPQSRSTAGDGYRSSATRRQQWGGPAEREPPEVSMGGYPGGRDALPRAETQYPGAGQYPGMMQPPAGYPSSRDYPSEAQGYGGGYDSRQNVQVQVPYGVAQSPLTRDPRDAARDPRGQQYPSAGAYPTAEIQGVRGSGPGGYPGSAGYPPYGEGAINSTLPGMRPPQGPQVPGYDAYGAQQQPPDRGYGRTAPPAPEEEFANPDYHEGDEMDEDEPEEYTTTRQHDPRRGEARTRDDRTRTPPTSKGGRSGHHGEHRRRP